MKTKRLLATAVACFICATVTMAQTVPSYVPTNGLVGWWPFNGNANDESGNGNNGTVNGATLTNDRNGNVNCAYSFDGVDDYILALKNTTFSNQITFNAWANLSQLGGVQTIFCSWGTNSSQRTFTLYYESSSYHISIQTTNAQEYCVSTTTPVANTWTMLTGSYDGLNLKLYENGQLVSTTSTTNSSFGPIQYNQYFMGTEDPNIQLFYGKIDDIGIWNRALSQQEITALYTGQTPCTKPEPVSLGTSMSTELCPNEAVTIKIVTPADSANYTYQWTRNGTNMVGATTRSITVNDAAKYKVFVRSGPGVDCQRVSGLVETTPSITPAVTATAPNGTAYCPGDSVLMTATGATTGYSYRWKRFGVVIPGANSNTYYATQTGNYRCEIFNAGGCITQSNLISITNGTSCRIIGETNSDVSVYPNPAKNSFTVSFNDIGNETPVSVSLRSMQGQVIENRKLASKEDVQFAVGKLSPGLYMVSILLDSGDSIEKTVVVE
ncbi:MAG: LamG-like jellyroll fold domain-containing protein [Arcticibacter sp.]